MNNRYYSRVFLNELHYNNHIQKNKHNFPTRIRARDWILNKATNPWVLVATEAFVDKSIRIVTRIIVASTNSVPEIVAKCKGKLNRKNGATPYKKPKKLLDLLKDLYYLEPKLN